MDKFVFLTVEEVLEIHQDQIARYGGAAGVREDEPALSDLVLAVAKDEAGTADVVAYLKAHAEQ